MSLLLVVARQLDSEVPKIHMIKRRVYDAPFLFLHQMTELMKSKRILFINYEYPPLGGGGGHACQQIAQEMAALGHEVHVITSRFSGLNAFEILRQVHVRRIPTLRRRKDKCTIAEMLIFLISSLVFTPFYHQKIKPDLVICFFSIPCGPAALWLYLLFRTPYVVALRGGDVPGFLPEKLAVFHKMTNWLTRLIWRFSKAVTANSVGLANLANAFYPTRNVDVIPNGVDARFDFKRVNSNSTFTKSTLNVLTVGRLNEQKKVYRLIEVFSRLFNQNSNNIILRIVGDGPQRAQLEELAITNNVMNQSVFFEGWKDRDELIDLYQKSDVLVLASDYEGMPNVVLEAMASSLAIVATNAPGTIELVKTNVNGFLVDRNNLNLFDEYLVKLKSDPDLLKSMQTKSYNDSQNYSWKCSAEMYLNYA